MSKEERTGWRHMALSLRHRAWGLDCPATDIDWLAVEYDHAKARGIVEYKEEHARIVTAADVNRMAIRDLCNDAKLPYLGCRYASDFSWWKVTPLNVLAVRFVPRPVRISEKDWVTLLYGLRGRSLPDLEIFDEVHTA